MQKSTSLALVVLASLLLAAPFAPLSSPKSTNPCNSCHGDGRYMYLDILEGDAGNTLTTAISDSQVLPVAVLIEVTGNTALNNVMSGITATLASQNGFFSVAVATYNIGTLVAGQKATAYWNISVVSAGNDVMLVPARGLNSHKNQQFSDSYSPQPTITVNKAAGKVPPSLTVTSPADGQTVKGTLTVTGSAAKGTLDVLSVQYRLDSGQWADASGLSGWQFTLDTTRLQNGAHTIEVRSYDGSLYSTMASRSVTVNNQKAGGGGSTPMLDGWVVLALLAAAGAPFYLRRS